MDLDRFTDDTPADDAPGGARVCVVEAQTERLNAVDRASPSPESYDRTKNRSTTGSTVLRRCRQSRTTPR